MTEWLVEVYRLLRRIREKALEALACLQRGDKTAHDLVKRYVGEDMDALRRLWQVGGANGAVLDALSACVASFEDVDLRTMTSIYVGTVEDFAGDFAVSAQPTGNLSGITPLLHAAIYDNAYGHLLNGHLRNAVCDGVMAIFEIMRERSSLTLDGEDLANAVFAPSNPMFVFSEIETESGRNEQKGFHRILCGVFQGIRNPKSHRLTHDLTPVITAQYLVFLSLLARRVSDALVNSAYRPPSP